jgi:glucose uptake protein GlcU
MCLKKLVCLLVAPMATPSPLVSPCLPGLFVFCMFRRQCSQILDGLMCVVLIQVGMQLILANGGSSVARFKSKDVQFHKILEL